MEEFNQKPRAHFQPCVLHCTCLHFHLEWITGNTLSVHQLTRGAGCFLTTTHFVKGEKAVCCSVSQIRLKRSNSVSSSHTETIYTCTIQLCWSILINLRKSRIGFKIPFSGKIRDVGMSYICCSWCVQWKELKIVSKTLLIFFIYLWIGFSH